MPFLLDQTDVGVRRVGIIGDIGDEMENFDERMMDTSSLEMCA